MPARRPFPRRLARQLQAGYRVVVSNDVQARPAMPIDVQFAFDAEHDLVVRPEGNVEAEPALRAEPSLYVVYNSRAERDFFVGTAQDLQSRFGVRSAACQEMGFRQKTLNHVRIIPVRVDVGFSGIPRNADRDPVARRPTRRGAVFTGIVLSDGARYWIDAERLLIRSLITQGHGVRNTAKTEAFRNATVFQYAVSLKDRGGRAVHLFRDGDIRFGVAAGATL